MNEQTLREKIGIAAELTIAPALGTSFSAAVLEIRVAGETVYASFFGETEPGQAVTPKTLFDLGTLAELFTATAFLRQVEVGRVWLDTPLNVVLPDADERLTFYHLLTQTSGLPPQLDLTNEQDYFARLTAIETAQPVRFNQPGYSPLAFMQMDLALDALNPAPHTPWFEEMLVRPLGLKTHTLEKSGASDVAALGQLYLDGGRFEGELFLSAALVDEALRDHGGGQGFVWERLTTRRYRVGGQSATSLLIDQDMGLVCALLTNGLDDRAVRDELHSALLAIGDE